jgi:8-oxo-dGTP pyrophosphatase MutT (NUDIX family)
VRPPAGTPTVPERAAIRRRLHELARVAKGRELEAGDEGRATGGRRVPAAVLVPIVARMSGPTVLLTVRTPHLEHHAGQICFPGGRIEPSDAHAAAAALREAEEETGLDPARVEVLGSLAPYDTVTGFRIHPVVGWVEPPVALRADPFEVAELFEVPLAFLLDLSHYRRESYEWQGLRRSYWVVPWQGYRIWGATAGILRNMAATLGGEEG